LRVLAAQGLLHYQIQSGKIRVNSNPGLEPFLKYDVLYADLTAFLKESVNMNTRRLEVDFCISWMELYSKYKDFLLSTPSEDSIDYQVLKHIEGTLVAPLIVRLGRSGMFHKYFMQASFSAGEFHKEPEYFEQVLSALSTLGWF